MHREIAYNYHHSRARRVTENAFGILAARWRVLGRPIECSPERAGDNIQVCVCLHNFLASADADTAPAVRYIPHNFVDSATATGEILNGTWKLVQGDNNLQESGRLSAA